jgi:hypothetical protein
MPDRDLAELQRQFHAYVTGTGDPGGLIATGEPAIYARMYRARLRDVLADDYPKLRAALGLGFGALVDRYLRAHPPTSFTLRDAGLALPDFAATDPLAPPWAAELARLERARVEVFDGPDAAALTRDDVAAGPPEALPALVLAWIPASVVVPLTWAVDDLWRSVEAGDPPVAPSAAARTVLVWRKDLEVLHRTLDPDEAALAPAIASGLTFADACAVVADHAPEDPAARAVALLLRWLDAAALRTPAAPPPLAEPDPAVQPVGTDLTPGVR